MNAIMKPGIPSKQTIERFPNPTPTNDVLDALLADGVVIIEDLISQEAVEQINRELDPGLVGPQEGFQDDMVVGRTRRLNAVMKYSPSIATEVVNHPMLIDAAESVLSDYTDTLQLVAVASEIAPGEEAQMLHRDDWNWGHIQTRTHPLSIFSIVALSEFTATSGATRAVPGSHLWHDAYAASTKKESWKDGVYEELSFPRGRYDDIAVPASIRAGSAMMALGTTVHGAGPNTTTDIFRRGLQVKYCVGWLRPTTNNFLLYPPEVAKTLPEPVQRLLGYQLEAKHIGMLEQGVDPIELLRGHE
jgi:ectoine hydroxylase-related dioxygenase (phytanoyl-CoA dioxygenase family)